MEQHPRRIRVKIISSFTSLRVFLLEESVTATSSFVIVSDFNLIYVLDKLGDHFARKFDHRQHLDACNLRQSIHYSSFHTFGGELDVTGSLH